MGAAWPTALYIANYIFAFFFYHLCNFTVQYFRAVCGCYSLHFHEQHSIGLQLMMVDDWGWRRGGVSSYHPLVVNKIIRQMPSQGCRVYIKEKPRNAKGVVFH